MKVEQHLKIRRPFNDMEEEVVRRHLLRPDDVGSGLVDALRYILSFARMTLIRDAHGNDIDVSGFLAPHAWRVRAVLSPWLPGGSGADLWGAVRELPGLVRATRVMRRSLLQKFDLGRERLEDEVCNRHFVVVAGGGGGSGYGYAGAYMLLDRAGLQPELIVGTSMGGLIGLFRARRRRFDMAAMYAAGRSLSWGKVFRVLDSGSRYGIPATLRLFLHEALGPLFRRADGNTLTMQDLEIPTRLITTGITLEGLKHDLAYYENFMDEGLHAGGRFTRSGFRKIAGIPAIIRELVSDPGAIRQIVFGEDPLTYRADVLDAAGFSSAIPGLIHYDVLRDDPAMKRLLDQLYAGRGIARMAEGGIVNNVPASVAYSTVMAGELGRRNSFILAMDCFAPNPRNFIYYPLQQFVRTNVSRNIPFSDLYFPLKRVLNALNLVPTVDRIERAMEWTMAELQPHVPFLQEMCRPIPVLADS